MFGGKMPSRQNFPPQATCGSTAGPADIGNSIIKVGFESPVIPQTQLVECDQLLRFRFNLSNFWREF